MYTFLMRTDNRIILDLCGGTGAWSKPYADAGYDVRILDIEEGDDIKMLKQPDEPIYGILAAPPCKDLAGSGARWWKDKGEAALLDALSIADACLRIAMVTKPVFWALENPVGRLRRFYGPPTLIFNPYDYGDAYRKKTCLWGRFNVPMKREVKCSEEGAKRIIKMGSGIVDKERRSITPPGFAQCFFDANR